MPCRPMIVIRVLGADRACIEADVAGHELHGGGAEERSPSLSLATLLRDGGPSYPASQRQLVCDVCHKMSHTAANGVPGFSGGFGGVQANHVESSRPLFLRLVFWQFGSITNMKVTSQPRLVTSYYHQKVQNLSFAS